MGRRCRVYVRKSECEKEMGKRIEREKATVEVMIAMYCRGNGHESEGGLCRECAALAEYAKARLSRCHFGDSKPTCRRCRIHCYSGEMRGKIVEVMRWSGRRMVLRHPVMALRHLLGV